MDGVNIYPDNFRLSK